MLLLLLLQLIIHLVTAMPCEWDCAQCTATHCTARFPCGTDVLCPLAPGTPAGQCLTCVSGICTATPNCTQPPFATAPVPVARPLMGVVTGMLLGLMLLLALCIGAYLTSGRARSRR